MLRVEREDGAILGFEAGRDAPAVAIEVPARCAPRDVALAVRRVADRGPAGDGPEAYVVEALPDAGERAPLVGAAVSEARGLGLHGHDYPARRALVVRVAAPGQA